MTGYASATTTALTAGAPFSIEVWASFTLGTANQSVVSFTQGTGVTWLGITSTNLPNFQVGTSSGNSSVSGTSAITLGWHHLAGTYDGASARLYVDGTLVGGPTVIASGAGGAASGWG